MEKWSFHRYSDGDINALRLELGNDIYPDIRFILDAGLKP